MLNLSFSGNAISANVLLDPSGWNIASHPNPISPLGFTTFPLISPSKKEMVLAAISCYEIEFHLGNVFFDFILRYRKISRNTIIITNTIDKTTI